MQNIKALKFMASEKKIFLKILQLKPDTPKGVAIFGPGGLNLYNFGRSP